MTKNEIIYKAIDDVLLSEIPIVGDAVAYKGLKCAYELICIDGGIATIELDGVKEKVDISELFSVNNVSDRALIILASTRTFNTN